MTRVIFLPSSFDRLDPIGAAVRWWISQFSEMFGTTKRKAFDAGAIESEKSRVPRNIAITLPPADGFTSQTSFPKGSTQDHQKALMLRVSELAPVDASALSIFAAAVERTQDGATVYQISMARKERLNRLEKIARRRGARSVVFKSDNNAVVDMVSPRASAQGLADSVIDASISVSIGVCAVLAVSSWTLQLQQETEALANEERALRRAAVATESARNAGELSRQLVERGILTRRGSAAVETIAVLNAATPDDTWWTRLRWSPAEVTISGQSPNATAAIGALSSAAKDFSVELSGPLNSATSDGLQSFEVVAKRRGASVK